MALIFLLVTLTFPFLNRFYSNPAQFAGTPCVPGLHLCDNHSAELSHRHGHLQAQVHRATLQAVCLKGQLPDG